MNGKIKTFKILDLFSGAGGFSYGMEKNEHFETVVAVDFNPNALATFKHNMPKAQIINGDITNPEIKKEIIELSKKHNVNMIIGGPPCQGFSLKGKKLGLDDPRNYLFNEYLSIVETLQPDVFTIENVKNVPESGPDNYYGNFSFRGQDEFNPCTYENSIVVK